MKEKYWVATSLISGVGPKTINKLHKEFGSLEKAWEASEDEIKKKFPLDNEQCGKFIKGKKKGLKKANNILSQARNNNIEILTLESNNYPNKLHELSDSPPVLYYKGEIKDWGGFSVAMVGTREPTDGGKKRAHNIAEDVAKQGGEVVSGLAYGIDTKSHEGCLDGRGRTIAVLGNGLLDIYPKENKGLATKIIDEGGLLLSEVPIHYTDPKPWSLKARNRIISALSDLTIVVEATKNSGSLITARHSRELGKPVVIPGPIDEEIPEHEGLSRIAGTKGMVIPYSDSFLPRAMKETGHKLVKKDQIDTLDQQTTLTDRIFMVKEDKLSEDDYIRGLLYIIGTYLKERDLDQKYINEIKLQKIVHSIVEEFSHPVTRSWYKRGVYIQSPVLSLHNLENFEEYSKYEGQLESNKIKKYLHDNLSENILFKETEKYLSSLYENEAPAKYRDIYISAHNLLSKMKEISNKNSSKSQMRLSKFGISLPDLGSSLKPIFNDFTTAIKKNPDTEFMGAEIDEVSHEFLKTFDSLSENNKNIDLEQIINLFYDKLWSYPAAVICKNTVKGPREEKVKNKMEKKLSYWENDVNEIENKLKQLQENKMTKLA